MSKKTISIQNTYYDALYFASASINEKKSFHLPLSELRLLQKLIHYSSKQTNITWSSVQIGKHLFITPAAVDKYVERLKRKGYINVSTTQIFEKVKSRTIFINWEQIERINELISDYQKENNAEEPIESEFFPVLVDPVSVLKVLPVFSESTIQLEVEENEEIKVEEPKFDIRKIFDSFIRDKSNEIDDDKFDKLILLIDLVQAGLKIGSTFVTLKQLSYIHTFISNKTKEFSIDEISEIQEIISKFTPEEIAA